MQAKLSNDIYGYFKKIKGNQQVNLNQELRKEIDTTDPKYSKYLDSPVTSSSNLSRFRSKPLHKIKPLPLPYRMNNLPRVKPVRRSSNDNYVISDDHHSLFFPRKVYNHIDQSYRSSKINITSSNDSHINIDSVLNKIKRRISPLPSRKFLEEFSRLNSLGSRYAETVRFKAKEDQESKGFLDTKKTIRICRRSRCVSQTMNTSSSSLSQRMGDTKMRTSISPDLESMEISMSPATGLLFVFPKIQSI